MPEASTQKKSLTLILSQMFRILKKSKVMSLKVLYQMKEVWIL